MGGRGNARPYAVGAAMSYISFVSVAEYARETDAQNHKKLLSELRELRKMAKACGYNSRLHRWYFALTMGVDGSLETHLRFYKPRKPCLVPESDRTLLFDWTPLDELYHYRGPIYVWSLLQCL